MVDDQRQEPTERTPKGLEVPVPKREDFLANLKKVAEPEKKPKPDSSRNLRRSAT